jgi:hypothetical protein
VVLRRSRIEGREELDSQTEMERLSAFVGILSDEGGRVKELHGIGTGLESATCGKYYDLTGVTYCPIIPRERRER